MNSRFLNWYIQAMGATFGIFACLFAYVNGMMFVYGNINNNFDSLDVGGVISSYLLLPLCILTLFLGIFKTFILDKHIFNISVVNINRAFLIGTAIIGILGVRIYFIIPAFFILFDIYSVFIARNKNVIDENQYVDSKDSEKEFNTLEFDKSSFTESLDSMNCINYEVAYNLEKEIKCLETKKSMAIELLEKDSDLQFIIDITGFTPKEIEELKK